MNRVVNTVTILLAIAMHFGAPPAAKPAGSNALDRINFGDTGTDSYSESVHQFDVGFSSLPVIGTGAFGQTYRATLDSSGSPANNQLLQFTMAVSSTKQNYLTVRVWGNDIDSGNSIYLVGTTFGGAEWIAQTSGPAPFPNRFCYGTLPIPLSMTQGNTSVKLQLYTTGTSGIAGRPVYSAYTHTDPHFVPDGNDPVGVDPASIGQIAPSTLTSTQLVNNLLEVNRENIYGSTGYYNAMLANQITPGQSGAPVETVGLDFRTNVAAWAAANPSATPDQWRDKLGGDSLGPGYSNFPDELLSVLVSTYFLQPFVNAAGTTVTGLDHYHDSTIIGRIVNALDGCTYMQAIDGDYNTASNNVWKGLTSTPRAAGHIWAGTTARNGPWSITLEGCDVQTLGYTISKLLGDSTAAPLFETYLNETYDANLDGSSILRATAYEEMLYNHLNYLKNVFDGGTESQGLFCTIGLYADQVALEKLQALYPNASYPALSGAAGVSFASQIMGVTATTSQMGNLYWSGGTNYGISKDGFGEAHGTLSCGYDGRYGTILPWEAVEIAQLAAMDPGMPSSTLSSIRTQANAAINAYDHFVSPEQNLDGLNVDFTLAQEDYITYRDPYGPNADADSFTVGTSYEGADSNMSLNDAFAKRSVYLEALYGVIPDTGAGGGGQLQYLRDIASYESAIRSLVNVNPASLTPLPGESGQLNSAFVDPQTGTAAIYQNGERFYLNTDWDSYEQSNTFGTPSNLARIHMTTSTIDRADLVYMPYNSATVQPDGNLSGAFGQPWVVRYGNYLLMGNPTTSSATLAVPAGSGVAMDLITGNKYNMGSDVTVSAGQAVALNLDLVTSVQPIANGTYTLTNISSNQSLDDDSSTKSGTQVVQWDTDGANTQQWVFAYNGSGYYTVKNVASGFYLTDPSGSTGNGAQLQQQTADSKTDQLWQLIDSGGSYVLVNDASGDLDVNDPSNSTTEGEGMILWTEDSGLNSVWTINPIPATAVQPLANGTYYMTCATSGLELEDPGASGTSGQQMDQWSYNGGTNQQWVFTYNGSGYYTVKNVSSGMYLTDPGGSDGNGAQLQQQTADGKGDQLWALVVDGIGYVLINQTGGIDVDDPASSDTVGQLLDIWSFGGNANQIWQIN